MLGPPTPSPSRPAPATPAHPALCLSGCVAFIPEFRLHGPDLLILFKLSIKMRVFFLLVLNIFCTAYAKICSQIYLTFTDIKLPLSRMRNIPPVTQDNVFKPRDINMS